MKIFIQSCDAAGHIDPVISGTLLDYLPNRGTAMGQADVVVVPVAYRAGYQFNENLNRINKPVVLMDFLEFGWSAGEKENRLGRGALQQFGHLASDEWVKLDKWAADHAPAMTFKRELFEKDRTDTMLPVEFPCRLPAPPLQTRAEFAARPLEVFSSWGLSSPYRPRLHGDIFRNAHDNGIHVIDGWDQDGHFEKRTWATIHVPHYNRKPIEEVMRWQQRAKISVSLPGAGAKCFRSSESPVGSIIALHDDYLAWSYPWLHRHNCIRITPECEFKCLLEATKLNNDELSDIYMESQETIEKYRSGNYVRDYILPAMKAV